MCESMVAYCMTIFSIQASTLSKFSIYIKVLIKYIYKSKYLMCEHEALPSGALFDIFSIWASTLSKFSISIKLLSNEICIYFDALIKFKEFVYIYI